MQSALKRIRQAQADVANHKFFRERKFLVVSKGRVRKHITAESRENAIKKIAEVIDAASHNAVHNSHVFAQKAVDAIMSGVVEVFSAELPMVFANKFMPVSVSVVEINLEMEAEQ